MKIILAALLVIATTYSAMAQFNGCLPGLCGGSFGAGFKPGGRGGAVVSGFLLSDVGSVLLVDTGVKFLIQ